MSYVDMQVEEDPVNEPSTAGDGTIYRKASKYISVATRKWFAKSSRCCQTLLYWLQTVVMRKLPVVVNLISAA